MPPRLGTLSRWGRTSDAGGTGEGGKEASNRGRGTREKGRRRVSVMVYSGEHNSLAHRSMVGNYCKFIRAARFHLPPLSLPLTPYGTSGFPQPRASTSDAFSIFHSHPPPATLGRSHRDPTAGVRKPLLAKLKLRHSARNAETIWLCNLWL